MAWDLDQASEHYGLNRWGKGYFGVAEDGNVEVQLGSGHSIDLKRLCDELMRERGMTAPILFRFSDILRARMQTLHGCFARARQEAGYQGDYFGVYPIKVNQQYQVVDEIIEFGAEFNWGLEAGSKPELHATLAMLEDVEGLIVCNGYKDREFIHLALLGRKIGKRVFIVVEKPGELDLILEVSEQLGIEPLIGLRCRLATTGEGRWQDSGGDASKFGLSSREILESVERLQAAGKLSCLRLLHFHLGSQIPRIRHIKRAMQEVGQFFVELHNLGAPIDYIDVGGGLGVDYDGSFSGAPSSVDYSIGEYANDIIWSMKSLCDNTGLPQPNIISESGRALVAHHAVLVTNVLDVSRRMGKGELIPSEDAPHQVHNMLETLDGLERGRYREDFHDAQTWRDDVRSLFSLGHCSLADRAIAEECYWRIVEKLCRIDEIHDHLGEELAALKPMLADRYFCNLSIFQSIPDAWAIDQIFPVCPIHRLAEEPTREGILVDITCDSDGKLENFPGLEGATHTLRLHESNVGEEYLIGIFLVGAYQEILGDLHNLFGDTHAVHVRMDGDEYEFEEIVEGESVAEVLEYVQFHEKVLIDRMRRQLQIARNEGRLSAREANAFINFYEEGLKGYTYLE